MQTVNHYFGHIGIFGTHILGFLVQRAVVVCIFDKLRMKTPLITKDGAIFKNGRIPLNDLWSEQSVMT